MWKVMDKGEKTLFILKVILYVIIAIAVGVRFNSLLLAFVFLIIGYRLASMDLFETGAKYNFVVIARFLDSYFIKENLTDLDTERKEKLQ